MREETANREGSEQPSAPPREVQFQHLFESMADAAYLVETGSGRILACNAAAERQTGYTNAELIGKDLGKDLPVQDPDIGTAAVIESISAGGSVRFVQQKRRKNGTLYWDEVFVVPFQMGPEPVHISINRDITDRVDRESAVRESETRYRSIFESTTDAVLIFNRDAVIVEANPNAYRMYGYAPGGLIGVSASEVIHADYFHGFSNFRTAIDNSGHFRARSVNLRKDGTPFDIEVHGGRFVFEGAPHLLAIIRDIRDQLAAERSLETARLKVERLHEAATQLVEAETEDDVYQVAVESAREILQFTYCTLIAIEGNNFVIKAASDGVPFEAESIVPINEKSVAANTFRSGETIVFGTQSEVPDARSALEDFQSGISAPIESVGIFQVLSREPNAFTEEDVRLLELLLRHTAQAAQRIRLQETLIMQANHDSLTGVYNRRYFNQVIEQELARSKRYEHEICFLMIDVDRFKEINDRFGHQTGDAVLKSVAGLLRDAVRESDVVVRYGGDEFLITLTEATSKCAEAITERINAAVSKRNESNVLIPFPVTLAIGSAYWNPVDDTPIEAVLSEADARMYTAKRRQNGGQPSAQ